MDGPTFAAIATALGLQWAIRHGFTWWTRRRDRLDRERRQDRLSNQLPPNPSAAEVLAITAQFDARQDELDRRQAAQDAVEEQREEKIREHYRSTIDRLRGQLETVEKERLAEVKRFNEEHLLCRVELAGLQRDVVHNGEQIAELKDRIASLEHQN